MGTSPTGGGGRPKKIHPAFFVFSPAVFMVIFAFGLVFKACYSAPTATIENRAEKTTARPLTPPKTVPRPEAVKTPSAVANQSPAEMESKLVSLPLTAPQAATKPAPVPQTPVAVDQSKAPPAKEKTSLREYLELLTKPEADK